VPAFFILVPGVASAESPCSPTGGNQITAALQTVLNCHGWFGLVGMMAKENATSLTPSEVTLGLADWTLLALPGAPPVRKFVGGLDAAIAPLC